MGSDYIPWWVHKLIEEGKESYGGQVTVKTPAVLKGKQSLYIALPARGLANEVEREAKKHGWVPRGYHSWDNTGGTISFCLEEDCQAFSSFRRG